KIGGDILLNKKTFLLVSALENASADQKAKITALYDEKDEEKKIAEFQTIYKELGIPELALNTMEEMHNKATAALMSTSISQESKESIKHLGDLMLRRTK